jgi:hypothetical protein
METKMEPNESMRVGRRLILTGSGALALSGCFGSFGATRALWSFNDDFGNKWIKWLVFLGFSILPVYALFVLADVLVLNSLEFWTGSNPIKSADGRTVTRVATADPNVARVEVRRGDELEFAALVRCTEAGIRISTLSGQVLSETRQSSDGSVELLDAKQRVVAQLSPAQLEQLSSQVQRGAAAHVAIGRTLGAERIAELQAAPASTWL